MSETQGSPAAASAPLDPAAAAEDAARKRAKTTEVLEEVLRKMELSGRAEVKDGPDGGISVALFVEGEVPQGQGRRSNFVDAIQFLANKIVNRPGTSKRWISIGLGAHPEPRPPREQRPPPAPAPQGAAPAVAAPGQQAPAPSAPPPQQQQPRPPRAAAPNGGAPHGHAHGQQKPVRASGPKPAHAPSGAVAPPAPQVEREPSEATMEVAEDPAITAVAKTLAARSAELGRFYAVSPMKPEDRARLFKAAQGVAGMKVKVEGDGRSRRVVFVPDKPTPMPKRALPVHDDEA